MKWSSLFLQLLGFSASRTTSFAALGSTSKGCISLLPLFAVASPQKCTRAKGSCTMMK
ncbi:hypothetical protein LINPERHAP1_LOCUS27051 [Linum perenne]